MAICDYCDQEMTTAESCSVEIVHRGLLILRLPRYGEEERFMGWGWLKWRTSHPRKDCGVAPGGLHHLGCDVAECPACGRQLISCGCRFDEDEAWGVIAS